jgi:hypothetical protein
MSSVSLQTFVFGVSSSFLHTVIRHVTVAFTLPSLVLVRCLAVAYPMMRRKSLVLGADAGMW